ncbi:hypothetical protein [Xanthomonas theicola]|uniref:hypothetical protein n=1 Tax=Xanthomonas theicola TaxID=56464 RepID=UPI000FF8B227|nr:hypothetical protein [Xanthomonas theicola]QNH26735.1 hypothetical protein G4Q83_21255 [Xanthomonas theicola]
MPQPPQPWLGHGLAQLLRGHCGFAALPRRHRLARRTGREPRRAIAPAALHAAHRGPMRRPLPQAHAQWLAQPHGVPADAGAWYRAMAPRWPAAAAA